MTGILFALIALLAILIGVNLLLTFALIRRVAEFASSRGPIATVPSIGTAVGAFAAVTVVGDSFGLDDLRSADLTVLFMMTGCEPCHALLTDLSTRQVTDIGPVFAFIGHHGDPGDEAVIAYRSALPAGVRCAVTSPTGDVARAFGVQSFPTVLRLEHGVITVAGRSLDAVFRQPTLAPA